MKVFFFFMITQTVYAFLIGYRNFGTTTSSTLPGELFDKLSNPLQLAHKALVEKTSNSSPSFEKQPPLNLTLTAYIYETDSETNHFDVRRRNLHEQLLALVDTLKGFFVGYSFAVHEFEAQAKLLHSKLVGITNEIHKLRRRQVEDMYDQLDYVHHMFRDMIRSIELLKHYPAHGSTDVHLVHCMIELNIVLYSLFNAYGIPDIETAGFSYKVSRFLHDFQFWCAEFGKLSDVPIGISWMFGQQYNRARSVLEFLETQIPVNERFNTIREQKW